MMLPADKYKNFIAHVQVHLPVSLAAEVGQYGGVKINCQTENILAHMICFPF